MDGNKEERLNNRKSFKKLSYFTLWFESTIVDNPLFGYLNETNKNYTKKITIFFNQLT